jgi:hypothetical protein
VGPSSVSGSDSGPRGGASSGRTRQGPGMEVPARAAVEAAAIRAEKNRHAGHRGVPVLHIVRDLFVW